MIRLSLAIPAVAVLFLASSISFHAQEYPTAVTTASATAPSPRPSSLSDEEQARLYLVRKQFKEAQDLFHKLTVEYPKNAVYWNELGIAFHNQIELAAALKCYEKAAKLDSHYADAVNNMGTIWYERKKYPKAIRAVFPTFIVLSGMRIIRWGYCQTLYRSQLPDPKGRARGIPTLSNF